jgi:Zn-dependent peptidase ImmA (M78 family)
MARPKSKPRLASRRREEIEQLAQAVVEARCTDLPIDPAVVAEANDITLSFNDYGQAFDGMLEQRGGRFHIYCNTARTGPPTSPRTRFTLAHELGHYYLDAHRQALAAGAGAHGSRCQYESPTLVEQEADAFAAGLLMPPEPFARRGRRVEPGLAAIRSLATRFGVSLTAAAIRSMQLNLWPGAVVKWDRSGYAWKHLSAGMFAARYRRTVQRVDELPTDGPTRRALAGAPAPAAGQFEAASVASAWFPSVAPGSDRDAMLLEQAVSLGRWGALTILRPLDPLSSG